MHKFILGKNATAKEVFNTTLLFLYVFQVFISQGGCPRTKN